MLDPNAEGEGLVQRVRSLTTWPTDRLWAGGRNPAGRRPGAGADFVIEAAGFEHVTPRLPYTGVCSEPQRRFASLVGERVDRDLRRRLQTSLGGPTGCAQLYDLTADLLKLLA